MRSARKRNAAAHTDVRRGAILAALCGFAWAAPLGVEAAEPGAAQNAAAAVRIDIAGRWQGRTYELSRDRRTCGEGGCTLTLDLVACGSGWCGVEVETGNRCGATAMRLDGGTPSQSSGSPLFKGSLSLAKGTEPYVVEVNFFAIGHGEGDGAPELNIVGDTGGEFRMFRRSFPFNATLAKVGEATCRPESTVSLRD